MHEEQVDEACDIEKYRLIIEEELCEEAEVLAIQLYVTSQRSYLLTKIS